VQKRKLIEVTLPLEAINSESAHEKSVPRKGHPATLHLWWARRPLAAARALLFAQLVDDPSSRLDLFPTEGEQRAERERLHEIIVRLSKWESTNDSRLLAEAHEEIVKSTGGSVPHVVDPFAGGGTIPLEAQRLGLQARASDLNPVAGLINKSLIDIPVPFRNRAPAFPGLADSEIRDWSGTQGLAADVRAYGAWMREEAFRRIGSHFPQAKLDDGSNAVVIAWIWARTVVCPNPACGIDLPLVRTWWLGKKKGREAYIRPTVVGDPTHPSGLRVKYAIAHDRSDAPTASDDGTVGRTGATCISCSAGVDLKHIRAEGQAGRIGQQLMAAVAEGNRRRVYLAPSQEQVAAAEVDRPVDLPDANIPPQAPSFRVQAYGMNKWVDLYTNRQLAVLATFSDLVGEARERVIADSRDPAYADAVATYLAFLGSKLADWLSSLCSWIPQIEGVRDTFARQALPMVWDFVEINPFSNSVGNASGHFEWIVAAIESLPQNGPQGIVTQEDAAARSYDQAVIATDPPYYDNIGYSDLSDYFYVWLRRSLRSVHPDLLSTMLVPKTAELVANQFRHGGKAGAEKFFEDGFRSVFAHARSSASAEFPITVYYAFKQSDADDRGEASTGWEKLLEGMIRSGWEITSTWPLRSERGGRMISIGTNALASSIILSLRPRPEATPNTDRRGFIAALEAELPDALRKLQQGQIAPVDLPQAAIGPGMAVFSRYGAVLEPDGKKMTVRSALARINEILDQVLNEQEGDFDAPSRFAIAWYRQHGYDVGAFGDANNLANARNITVDAMDRDGVLTSRAGKVQLIKPADLSWDYNPVKDTHTSNWETLHHLIKVLERDGIAPAGDFLQAALTRPDGAVDADLVKELAHLLFRVAEGNGWTKDALSFNSLVTSWPEIIEVARSAKKPTQTQDAFEFDEDD
jgi:putative DNA methylase